MKSVCLDWAGFHTAIGEWLDKLIANGTFHPYVWRECCRSNTVDYAHWDRVNAAEHNRARVVSLAEHKRKRKAGRTDNG